MLPGLIELLLRILFFVSFLILFFVLDFVFYSLLLFVSLKKLGPNNFRQFWVLPSFGCFHVKHKFHTPFSIFQVGCMFINRFVEVLFSIWKIIDRPLSFVPAYSLRVSLYLTPLSTAFGKVCGGVFDPYFDFSFVFSKNKLSNLILWFQRRQFWVLPNFGSFHEKHNFHTPFSIFQLVCMFINRFVEVLFSMWKIKDRPVSFVPAYSLRVSLSLTPLSTAFGKVCGGMLTHILIFRLFSQKINFQI